MKKLLLPLLIIVSVLFSSCEKEYDDEEYCELHLMSIRGVYEGTRDRLHDQYINGQITHDDYRSQYNEMVVHMNFEGLKGQSSMGCEFICYPYMD